MNPGILPSGGLLENLGLRIDPASSSAPSGGLKWGAGDILSGLTMFIVGVSIGFIGGHEIGDAVKRGMA